MHHTLLFVEIADAMGDLHDDMPRKLLGEVGELDDLVEKLAALAALNVDIRILQMTRRTHASSRTRK
jgi:hypothetical protein